MTKIGYKQPCSVASPFQDQISVFGLNFQPMGISVRPEDQMVIMADYDHPAVWMVNAKERVPKWTQITAVAYKGEVVRMFPDIREGMGANRVMAVMWTPGGGFYLTRGDERYLWHYVPPTETNKMWELCGEIRLPFMSITNRIEAACLASDLLYTIETHDYRENSWFMVLYRFVDGELEYLQEKLVFNYTYGIAVRGGGVWTVTDFRAPSDRWGVYCNDRLVIPGICGNGLAFLADGSLMVTQYAGDNPLDPCKLIRIPASLLCV